ncbi:MAG: Lrp/AsnC family transcriptional regulator [Candidatus Diapherotrites archaeon]
MSRKFTNTALLEIADKLKYLGVMSKIDYSEISKNTEIRQKILKSAIEEMAKRELAKISVSINFKKLPVILARIAIKSKKAQYNEKIFEIIKSLPYLSSAAYVTGMGYSHIMSLVVPDFDTLCKLVNENAKKLEGLIENTNTMVVRDYVLLENYKYTKEKTEKVELDKNDWKILYALRENATNSLSALSKSVGLQAPSIHRRIKRLKKEGVINGYYCNRFVSKKPSEFTQVGCFVAIRHNGAEKDWEKIITKIMNNKTCWKTHVVLVFGEFDISFNLWADSPNLIREFINDLVSENENILGIDSSMILDYYKGNFTKSFAK